jgi:hypothetical protein
MAKIVDPDSIAQTTDVVYDTGAKTIQIKITGAISDDSPGKTSGITGKCLYSFTKEEWKTDTALNKFKFPIKMIYEASFQLINGWQFADQQTRDVLRDAGFQEIILSDEYSCMISLGDMDAPGADQAYYTNTSGLFETTSNFDKTGELNENVLVYDGAVDTRDYIKLFLREQGKLYAEYNLHVEQGLSTLKYEAYKFPLSNGSDIKVTLSDAALTGAPYDDMTIDYIVGTGFTDGWTVSAGISADAVYQDTAGRWAVCTVGGTLDAAGVADWTANGGTATLVAYQGERQIGSDYYAFNRVVAASGGTVEQVHMWCQYQLRLDADINDDDSGTGFGQVRGKIATPLTSFIGDQLHTNPGMYVDELSLDDNNSITYWDITVNGGGIDSNYVPVTSTQRNNPFYASFTLVFSSNLIAETTGDTLFRVYFTNDDAGDNAGNDFDTSGAIVVQDKDSANIEGTISSGGVPYTFQYDYTNNVQRGAASAGTPAPITVVYQGLFDSEWNSAEFTIQQSTGQSFACNTADELNYDNPA